MGRRSSNNLASKQSSRPLLWLGALLLFAAALVGFARSKSHGPATGAAPGGSGAARQGYSNRSISQRPWGGRGGLAESPAIKGVVYDAEGHPLRDAAVTASTFEIAGNVPTPAGTARSDELGRFELPLREGTYQLSAGLTGYGPAGATAHTGDTIALVLPESGVISGRVLDEHGNPVSHFVIDVIVASPGDMPASPPVFSRRFDSLDGAFRVTELPSWDVVVRAAAEGYAPTYSTDISVPVGATRSLDLTLSRGCSLTGKVEDAAGAPAARVFVDAEAQLGVGAVGELSVQTANQTQTEDDGSFRLQNVPKGAVTVRAYSDDSAVMTASIEVGDCAQLSPLKMVMSAGATLSGVARSEEGAPIAGARLTLMARTTGFVSTATDAEGRFRFERLPPGRARLELSHEARGVQQFVKMEAGKETHIDLTVAASGTGHLRGRITAGGKPLAGAQLMVASNLGRGKGLGVFYPVTGSDGTYHLEDLPRGPYAVSVVSTPVMHGATIKADETATVDLDVTASLNTLRPREPETKPTSFHSEAR